MSIPAQAFTWNGKAMVVTQDQRCANLAALREGLTALARHFGLTPREKGLLPKSSIECVAPAP